jgi:hypothetical protein
MAPEQMEVANGVENIVKLTLQIISGTKNTLDCCFEHTGPSVLDKGKHVLFYKDNEIC